MECDHEIGCDAIRRASAEEDVRLLAVSDIYNDRVTPRFAFGQLRYEAVDLSRTWMG